MRTLTPTEQAALEAAHGRSHPRVEVLGSDGSTWNDLTAYVNTFRISTDVDSAVISASLQIIRSPNVGDSLSPLVTDALDAGRRIRIWFTTVLATAGVPSSGDLRLVLDGEIDSVDAGGPLIQLVVRDRIGATLADYDIRDQQNIGAEGTSLEALQQLLIEAANADSIMTLDASATAVSIALPVTVGPAKLLETMRTTAQRIGWQLRPRWKDSASAFQLAFYEPPRTSTTVAWTIPQDRYIVVPVVRYDRTNIRNIIRVSYYQDGVLTDVEVEDAASIARFGPRFAAFVEGTDSVITTAAQATAFANAALSDLSSPTAEFEVELMMLWPIDIDDIIELEANDEQFTTDQTLAVVGYEHRFGPNEERTRLRLRGKPTGGIKKWSNRLADSTATTLGSLKLENLRPTARNAETITYEWVRGGLVDTVWVYDRLFEDPLPDGTDPWPVTGDSPAVVLTTENEYVADVPPPGHIRYLQFVPMSAAMVQGPVERVPITPTLDPPDRIINLVASVNDDTGAVTVTVDAGDRTLSYRYAIAVGTDPAWPTDSEVEAGTVRTIVGSESFVLPGVTVAYNQKIRVRAAPYINDNGTGFHGTVVEHGEIKGAEDIRLKPPVELEISTETEAGAVATFGVTVRDPGQYATGLYYRTKSGTAAYGAWTLKTATPTNGTAYSETVALEEDHPSHIEFRLDYTFVGTAASVFKESSAFDRGKIPQIALVPRLNDANDTASASVQGDADTASIKIAASTSALPTDAAVRATTAIDGRMLTPADIGNLVSGLTAGQTVYFKAFGYSGAGGTGNESTAAATAQAVHAAVEPVLDTPTHTEVGTTGTYGITVRDPSAKATALYYQTKQGSGAWGAWTLKSGAPSNGTAYTETVSLVEGHQSFIRFRLDYTVKGVTRSVIATSGGFDRGNIPDGSIYITIDPDGDASATFDGDSDTLSWKYAASTSAMPSDATVRAATAVNGRVLAPSIVGTLVNADLGQTVFVKAFGYSATGGGGNESSAAIQAELLRSGATQPKVSADITRSGASATLTLTVSDPLLKVTAVEFNKREGEGALTGWITGWDTTTGTAGTDQTLTRTEAVAVTDGKDSEIRWRVTFTDENGDSKQIEDSIHLSNLRQLTKTHSVSPHKFVPSLLPTGGVGWVYAPGSLQPFGPTGSPADMFFIATLDVPQGVTISAVRAKMSRDDATNDIAEFILYEVHGDGTATSRSTGTHTGTGYATVTGTSVSEPTAGSSWSLSVRLKSNNWGTTHAVLAGAEVDYIVPDYSKTV